VALQKGGEDTPRKEGLRECCDGKKPHLWGARKTLEGGEGMEPIEQGKTLAEREEERPSVA